MDLPAYSVGYEQDLAASAKTTSQAIPFNRKNINAPIPARLSHNFFLLSFISDIKVKIRYLSIVAATNTSPNLENVSFAMAIALSCVAGSSPYVFNTAVNVPHIFPVSSP